MTKTKYLAVSAAVVVGSFFIAQTAFAHNGTSHDGNDSAVKTVSDDTTVSTQNTETEKQRFETFKNQFEQRKQELQQQVQQKRAAVKEKLSTARKNVCDKRQVNINKIITNSNAQGTRNLAVFESIQARVIQFATQKNLTVANYDALVADADAKRAAAQAALDISGQTTFSCDDTDPSSPGKVVSDLMHTKHDALKDYRTAIKNLIVAVKQAAGDKTNTTGSEQ